MNESVDFRSGAAVAGAVTCKGGGGGRKISFKLLQTEDRQSPHLLQRQHHHQTYLYHQEGHSFGINRLRFAPALGRNWLFSAGRDTTVRCWNLSNLSDVRQQFVLSGHTSWVNDLLPLFWSDYHQHQPSCSSSSPFLLLTASSDKLLKLWRLPYSDDSDDHRSAECLQSFSSHLDYVQKLAHCPYAGFVVSASLDGTLILWDVQSFHSVPVRSHESGRVFQCHDASLYSLAIGDHGSVIASGSSDGIVNLWDPRQNSNAKIGEIVAHSNVVRDLLFLGNCGQSSRILLSASSDRCIKAWDLANLDRCVHQSYAHQDSVWGLCPAFSGTSFFSAGRDGCVFQHNFFHNTEEGINSVLVYKNSCPALSVSFSSSFHNSRDSAGLACVSTTSPAINGWHVYDNVDSGDGDDCDESLNCTVVESAFENSMAFVLHGGRSGVVKSKILSNQRYVVALDSDNYICIYDIFCGHEVKRRHVSETSSEEIQREFEKVCAEESSGMNTFVPWFSLDTTSGNVVVHLNCPSCFNAEMYSSDLGISDHSARKFNVGETVISSLFHNWKTRRYTVKHSNGETPSFPVFLYPDQLEVVIDSQPDWCKYRIGEMQGVEKLPSWIEDCVLFHQIPVNSSTSRKVDNSANESEFVPGDNAGYDAVTSRFFKMSRIFRNMLMKS